LEFKKECEIPDERERNKNLSIENEGGEEGKGAKLAPEKQSSKEKENVFQEDDPLKTRNQKRGKRPANAKS